VAPDGAAEVAPGLPLPGEAPLGIVVELELAVGALLGGLTVPDDDVWAFAMTAPNTRTDAAITLVESKRVCMASLGVNGKLTREHR